MIVDGNKTTFKLIADFTVVLVTCKNEEDSFQNERSGVVTSFLLLLVYRDFFKRSGAANSSVPGPILQNFEPI